MCVANQKLNHAICNELFIQHFEADFLWKVSLKILNSGLILKMFPHAYRFPNIHMNQLVLDENMS